MSNLTPNRIITGGFLTNTSSSVAPSLTDPSLNTAYKNQIVEVGTDYYFVDYTGKAEKLGGGGAPEAVTFGTAAPTSTTALAGDRYFRTSDGSRTGEILEEYIFDGTGWIRLETHRQNFITNLTPVYYSAGSWLSAQANNISSVAEGVQVTLADGTTEIVRHGKYTYPSHGLTVGASYYLDKNVAGGITTVLPTGSEIEQFVLIVHDDNTIEISLEQPDSAVTPVTTAGTMITRFVNRGVDVIMDNIKVRVNPTATTLQIGSVTGTFTAHWSTQCDYNSTSAGTLHQVRPNVSVTTTYQTVDTSGWGFFTAGARQIVDLYDVTNLRRYRVTYIVNNSYNNNAITIERLA